MHTEHPELRLTYAQLGARLEISADAARMLARRRGWQRIAPNRRGAPVVVVVSAEALEGEQWRTEPVDLPPNADENTADTRVNTAEERAEFAEQRAEQAERRADEANARADAALALSDRMGVLLSDAGSTIERLRADLSGAREGADALRTTIDELKAGQALMLDMHARELTEVRAAATETRERLQRVQDAAEALRRAEEARKARGRWARLRAAWLGQ